MFSLNTQEWRLIDRFKEPSSYAGLSTLLAMAGLSIPAPWVSAISLIGSGICILLSIVLKEGARPASSVTPEVKPNA